MIKKKEDLPGWLTVFHAQEEALAAEGIIFQSWFVIGDCFVCLESDYSLTSMISVYYKEKETLNVVKNNQISKVATIKHIHSPGCNKNFNINKWLKISTKINPHVSNR